MHAAHASSSTSSSSSSTRASFVTAVPAAFRHRGRAAAEPRRRHQHRHFIQTNALSSANNGTPPRRARGGDYNAAAATFASSFFYDGKVDPRDVEYKGLTRACGSDMRKRYSARGGDGSALVVIMDEEDSSSCLACGGVEVRKYVGANDYETMVKNGKAGGGVEEKIINRPIVANLATAREARRRGYGKAIMAELEEICAENGFDECCLVVEAGNRRAQSLYKKLGYRVIGGDSNAAALKVIDGRSVETTTKTLVMRKSLTNPLENLDFVSIGAAVALLVALSTQKDVIAGLF